MFPQTTPKIQGRGKKKKTQIIQGAFSLLGTDLFVWHKVQKQRLCSDLLTVRGEVKRGAAMHSAALQCSWSSGFTRWPRRSRTKAEGGSSWEGFLPILLRVCFPQLEFKLKLLWLFYIQKSWKNKETKGSNLRDYLFAHLLFHHHYFYKCPSSYLNLFANRIFFWGLFRHLFFQCISVMWLRNWLSPSLHAHEYVTRMHAALKLIFPDCVKTAKK